MARQKGLAGLEIVNVGEGALIRRLNPESQQAHGSIGQGAEVWHRTTETEGHAARLVYQPCQLAPEKGACIEPWLFCRARALTFAMLGTLCTYKYTVYKCRYVCMHKCIPQKHNDARCGCVGALRDPSARLSGLI